MKIVTLKELLSANVLCNEDSLGKHVYSASCSDMMSDVLAYQKEQAVLVTNLVNVQVVRTAEMMDMACVVFANGKRPTSEMIELANDNGMVLMSTEMSSYESCGILFENGLKGGRKV